MVLKANYGRPMQWGRPLYFCRGFVFYLLLLMAALRTD